MMSKPLYPRRGLHVLPVPVRAVGLVDADQRDPPPEPGVDGGAGPVEAVAAEPGVDLVALVVLRARASRAARLAVVSALQHDEEPDQH